MSSINTSDRPSDTESSLKEHETLPLRFPPTIKLETSRFIFNRVVCLPVYNYTRTFYLYKFRCGPFGSFVSKKNWF